MNDLVRWWEVVRGSCPCLGVVVSLEVPPSGLCVVPLSPRGDNQLHHPRRPNQRGSSMVVRVGVASWVVVAVVREKGRRNQGMLLVCVELESADVRVLVLNRKKMWVRAVEW